MESEEKKQSSETSQDMIKKWDERKKLFDKNSSCTYNKEYKNLDSSIKKIGSFMKKIKSFSDANYESVMKELKILNLRRYLSEIVSAIFEFKFKILHIPLLINFISKVHRRYSEFSNEFLNAFHDRLSSFPNNLEDDGKNIKVITSLFISSILAGIFENPQSEFQLLIHFWHRIFAYDKLNDFMYCKDFSYFVQMHGIEFDLISNEKIKSYEEDGFNYQQMIISVKNIREAFLHLVQEYYTLLEEFCQKGFRKYERMTKSNELYVGLNGALTSEQKKAYKSLCDTNDRVFPAAKILADCLNKSFELKSEEVVVEQIVNKVDEMMLDFEEKSNVDNKWEDEDDKRFYEDLKNYAHLCHVVNENELEKLRKTIQEQFRSNRTKMSQSQDDDFDEDFDLNEYQSRPKLKNANMEAFITKLKTCINRDLIDGCVEDFFKFHNIKANRKIVVENIFGVSRDRLDLLPFYARFLASTYPYCPEMALEVAILLRKEFYYHLRKQSQFNIQAKIKSCRFIGELVKFKIFSKLEGINFLKSLLIQFQGHSVDMLCHLLESCGRFLNNSPESRPLLQSIISTVEKKAASVTEGEYKIQIRNAINSCDPQKEDISSRNIKELPILDQFIRYLVFDFLNRNNIAQVVESFKLLPLNQEDCLRFVLKCLTRPWKLKYANISCLASLIFQIRKFATNIDVMVVDEIIEEIRLGLETNFPRHNQRRMCTIRFFGELYNFQIIEADMILACSFNLITFGHRGMARYSSLDPATNHVRIHLVCELFKSCGHYLIEDSKFPNFDGFFVLFQAYFWHKKLADYYTKFEHKFPPAVEANVKEMFENLRLKRRYLDSPEKVLDAFSKQTCSVYGEIGHVLQRYLSRGIEIKLQKARKEVEMIEKSESEEEGPIDEEAEFEREYERTLIESMNEKSNASGTKNIDLVLPSNLKDKYFSSQNRLEEEIKNQSEPKLKLCLLTKKNNKKVLKDVDIPKAAPLARTVIHKYNGRMDELKEVKRVILNMNKK